MFNKEVWPHEKFSEIGLEIFGMESFALPPPEKILPTAWLVQSFKLRLKTAVFDKAYRVMIIKPNQIGPS